MSDAPKLAVILFNLGGPSSMEAIQPFLFNFFRDKNILSLPNPFRYFLAAWIAWTRSQGAAKESYGVLGGKTPLLENTQAQAQALEQVLQNAGAQVRVFVSMRYWHPLAAETVRAVKDFQPDQVILLPLYPQYSATTSFSSLQNWQHEARRAGLQCPMTEVCCYPEDKGFIEASTELVRSALQEAPKKTRLLFSAHGLPERNIEAGDPYQYQIERTAAAIVKRLDIPLLDWQLCYQSRVGRLKWIGPSTDEALEKAADDNVGVVIYPLAFVSEHVETLVEIDIEYRDRAKLMGIPYFAKVPTVGTHRRFIEGLRDLVLLHAGGKKCDRICPESFGKCNRGVSNKLSS